MFSCSFRLGMVLLVLKWQVVQVLICQKVGMWMLFLQVKGWCRYEVLVVLKCQLLKCVDRLLINEICGQFGCVLFFIGYIVLFIMKLLLQYEWVMVMFWQNCRWLFRLVVMLRLVLIMCIFGISCMVLICVNWVLMVVDSKWLWMLLQNILLVIVSWLK